MICDSTGKLEDPIRNESVEKGNLEFEQILGPAPSSTHVMLVSWTDFLQQPLFDNLDVVQV